MYTIKGNTDHIVKPGLTEVEGLLNGDFYSLDIEKIDAYTWHVLKDHNSYYIQWVTSSEEDKTYTLKVNGFEIELQAKNDYDMLLDKMGLSSMAAKKHNQLKAPMPGKVLSLMVEVGQSVLKGDALLILEAMKMENVLKAEADGVVKTVNVAVGDAVEKKSILIEFE